MTNEELAFKLLDLAAAAQPSYEGQPFTAELGPINFLAVAWHVRRLMTPQVQDQQLFLGTLPCSALVEHLRNSPDRRAEVEEALSPTFVEIVEKAQSEMGGETEYGLRVELATARGEIVELEKHLHDERAKNNRLNIEKNELERKIAYLRTWRRTFATDRKAWGGS